MFSSLISFPLLLPSVSHPLPFWHHAQQKGHCYPPSLVICIWSHLPHPPQATSNILPTWPTQFLIQLSMPGLPPWAFETNLLVFSVLFLVVRQLPRLVLSCAFWNCWCHISPPFPGKLPVTGRNLLSFFRTHASLPSSNLNHPPISSTPAPLTVPLTEKWSVWRSLHVDGVSLVGSAKKITKRNSSYVPPMQVESSTFFPTYTHLPSTFPPHHDTLLSISCMPWTPPVSQCVTFFFSHFSI